MPHHGVIFDMDGVLVASGPAHAASWRLVAKKHGIAMSDEFFKHSFGRPSRDIIRDLWQREMSVEEIHKIDTEKEALYRDLVTGMVPLTIGTKELLHSLTDAGYALAVATSGPPENVQLVLTEKRLTPLFKAVVTGFDVKHGKPAPDCFLLAAERIGLSAAQCVVIEDAPVGLAAATAAGMKSVGFVGTHPAETLEKAGATAIVRELREITPQLVSSLLN